MEFCTNPQSLTSQQPNQNHRRVCWLLYLSGFLDLCGVGLILALMPSMVRQTGASTTLTGFVGSVYGGLQLVSSPLMGKWADRVSRKSSILLSLGLSCLGYGLLGLVPSIYGLVAARVVLGCFKHSQTMSKAYLADVITDRERPSVLGRFNSMSSIGLVIGPTLGGHLAETSWGYSLVALVCALVFGVNAVLVWGFLPHKDPTPLTPHTSTPQNEASSLLDQVKVRTGGDESKVDNISPLLLIFWDLFLIIFFGSFSVIIYRNNFSLMMKEKFLASPTTLGYITSLTGLVSTLSGFLLGTVTHRYKNKDDQLFVHVTIVQVFVLTGLCLAPSIPVIVAFLIPLSVCTSLTRVTTTSITIHRCGKDRMAAVMGWSQSVTSLARMLSPLIAGLVQEYSMEAACYISLAACVFSLVLMTVFPQGTTRDLKMD